MKEIQIDFLLGQVLRINGERWRVLELDARQQLRLFSLDRGHFGSFDWTGIKALIRQSLIEVE
jgi:hypothetical protein